MIEIDLMNELQAKLRQLEDSLKKLRINGTNYAKAERDYKILFNSRL